MSDGLESGIDLVGDFTLDGFKHFGRKLGRKMGLQRVEQKQVEKREG